MAREKIRKPGGKGEVPEGPGEPRTPPPAEPTPPPTSTPPGATSGTTVKAPRPSCLVTFENYATGAERATGFVPKEGLTGTAVSQPTSGHQIAVWQTWENFSVSAARNFLEDMLATVRAFGTAIGRALTGTDLSAALTDLVSSVEPLLHGKRLQYRANWHFTFTCSATIDEQEDPDRKFEVISDLMFESGVVSADASQTIRWTVHRDVTVIDRQMLEESGTDDSKPRRLPSKAEELGPGSYRANEILTLILAVDGYGDQARKLVEDMKSLLKSTMAAVSSLDDALKVAGGQQAAALAKARDAAIAAAKSAISTMIDSLQEIFTRTVGEIHVDQSYFVVRCKPKS